MVVHRHCNTDIELKNTIQPPPSLAMPTTQECRTRNPIPHRMVSHIIRHTITMALHNILNIPSQAPLRIGHTMLLKYPTMASTFSHQVTLPKYTGNRNPLPSLLLQEQSASTTSHHPRPAPPNSHKYPTSPNLPQTTSSPLPSLRIVSKVPIKNSSYWT